MAIRQTQELDRALQAAADRGDVSAVLIVPHEPVTFRLTDGGIERAEGPALSPDEIRDIAVAALGEDRLARVGTEVGQAITSCALPGVVDGRLCVSRCLGDYSILVRILVSRDLSDLATTIALPPAVIDAALAPAGLVLSTGPAGSGKTTTQYALLSEINQRRACHLCTVEYMVGMLLPPDKAIVQQREIGIDVPDCMSGIQASMAQDLDVLMVGEIRAVADLEACIRVASHGHLVITQLHVPTPEAAIARIAGLVDDTTRGQLAGSLRAVCAQHLLPRADGSGRVAAYGVLVPDDAMRRMIADGRDLRERSGPDPDGCRSLHDDVERLRREGTVTEEDAREAVKRVGERGGGVEGERGAGE